MRNPCIIATYEVESDDMDRAAQAIAYGQSIGNPTLRANGETRALMARHCAQAQVIKHTNKIVVKYPRINWARGDGFNYLLSMLMGGQCDIDLIKSCRLIALDLGVVPRAIMRSFSVPTVSAIYPPYMPTWAKSHPARVRS